MRLNCNDIDIILDGLDDYRGLCEYDEVNFGKRLQRLWRR